MVNDMLAIAIPCACGAELFRWSARRRRTALEGHHLEKIAKTSQRIEDSQLTPWRFAGATYQDDFLHSASWLIAGEACYA